MDSETRLGRNQRAQLVRNEHRQRVVLVCLCVRPHFYHITVGPSVHLSVSTHRYHADGILPAAHIVVEGAFSPNIELTFIN